MDSCQIWRLKNIFLSLKNIFPSIQFLPLIQFRVVEVWVEPVPAHHVVYIIRTLHGVYSSCQNDDLRNHENQGNV